MRRRYRPARGLWTLLQAVIFLGLAVLLAGAAVGYGEDSKPETPHRLGPANSATLTDSLQHDLDNCRALINSGGRVEDC